MNLTLKLCVLALLLASIAASIRLAAAQVLQTVPAAVAARHPWQAITPHLATGAWFTNLEDGAKIQTPYLATFGLDDGWGLAPIASPVAGKSGHHHLLINRDLPLDFKKVLPFNEQHVHFGKGQMESLLTMAPGEYTLRLLFADDQHLPRFVYSKAIKITVTKNNKDVDPKSLIKPGLRFIKLPADNKVAKIFNVQFHASGLNVGHQSQQVKGTGHFRLTVAPQDGSKPAVLDFPNGQTGTWLVPPVGAYTLKLDFVDNINPDKFLVPTAVAAVEVSQAR